MNRFSIFLLVFFTQVTFADISAESDSLLVRHYQTHYRYEFGVELLKLALQHSGKPYRIEGVTDDNMNEARGESLVINGTLDVEFLSTTAERERRMIPIRIPVYRGLLGLRLLLVKPENQVLFKNVKTVEDLRRYVGGHGKYWGDLPVYEANQLKVMPIVEYRKIFEMLKEGRVDYFHRGVSEIWDELKRYRQDFEIADGVMLFYSHPVYFFVTNTRPDLAEDIERGLNLALKDGSYEHLFEKYYREVLNKAGLRNRTLIRLKNPVPPANTPAIDTSWWLPHQFNLPE